MRALLLAVLALQLAGGPAATGGTLVQGPVRFHFAPAARPLARHLAALAAGYRALPGLPPDVLRRGPPVEVYLAPTPAAFDSLTGGAAPDWGAGVAAPESGIIVLPAYFSRRADESQLGEILRHELAHIGLHRYLAPARVPRWFDEGYATWAAGGLDWQSAWLIRIAFALHRAPPLDSLELEFPAGETDARVAYLLSATAVQALAQRAGDVGLTRLLARWRKTGSFEIALRRTFGVTSGQFEREWRESVKRRYGWLVVLGDTAVFWLLVAPGLVALWLIRRRRDRARLERLRASEPPDAPAFWVEEGTPEPPSDVPNEEGRTPPAGDEGSPPASP